MQSLLKRLGQKSQNVILTTIFVIDTLSKNCGRPFHLEMASKAHMQLLTRHLYDESIHDRVKTKILQVLSQWEQEFGPDQVLSLVHATCQQLRQQGYMITTEQTSNRSSTVSKDEERQLQIAMELSLKESESKQPTSQFVVNAVYDFIAKESDELSFNKGDIITVLDHCHPDWWKGSLNGRIGLFPRNYTTGQAESTFSISQDTTAIETFINNVKSHMDTYGTVYPNLIEQSYNDSKIQQSNLMMHLQAAQKKRDDAAMLLNHLKACIDSMNRMNHPSTNLY